MSLAIEARQLDAIVSELLVRHERTQGVIDFTGYRGRPLDFMREQLAFEPYEKQREVILAFEKYKKVAVRGCHGAGKDAVLAPIALYAAYVLGMLVLVISATEKQLLGQTWKELDERFTPSKLPGDLYTADLRINGKKRILAMTSGAVSNLTGWHDKHGVCVLISEAQGEQTEAAAFDAADANTTDDKSKICVVGNPIAPGGRFFEVSRRATWHAIKMSAFDHPNIQEGRMVIPGGPAPSWPAEMAAEYGAESPWYTARVLGEFPDTGIENLIRRAWIDRAVARWQDNATRARVSSYRPWVIADIARGGPDLTCIGTVRGDKRLVVCDELETSSEPDTMRTAATLVEKARTLGFWSIGRRRPTLDDIIAHQVPIVCDDVGVGGGVTDRVRELRGNARPFNGAHKSTVVDPRTQQEKYANLRAESYFVLRDALRDDVAAFPPDAKRDEELLAIQFSHNAAGRLIVEPKIDIRKRLKRSPDRADVVSMGVWAVLGAAGQGWSIGSFAA